MTITGGQTFPEGTVVGAYPRSQWVSWQPPSGAPSGAATATATVTNGLLTFNGLADSTSYVAYASTPDRYKKFSTPAFAATAPTFKVLTADMAAITANQTVQDIPGLGVDIGASTTEIWLLKFWILVQADNQTMDAKFGWTSPAGAIVRWGGLVGGSGSPAGWGAAPTATSVTALGTGSTLSVGTASGPAAPSGVGLVAVVFGGGTAGTAQIRVAQNLSDVGALQILKGSMVEATKVAA